MQTYLTEATALNPTEKPYLFTGQLLELYPCTDTLLNKAALLSLPADYLPKSYWGKHLTN